MEFQKGALASLLSVECFSMLKLAQASPLKRADVAGAKATQPSRAGLVRLKARVVREVQVLSRQTLSSL